MGEGKTKRERFLAEHPLCFFCSEPVETIDHVPSRQCFYNGVGPEGFEFPACQRCNNSAGPTEQVVAFYLHMANQDTASDSSIGQFEKLVRGVQNNAPALMPKMDLSANYKRRASKRIGYVRGPGESYADAPIVELPDKNRDAFRVFARHLTCALYYRHTG
ncbi:hypothetical protein LJR234_003992 [Mesorhizobium amorphae]|uniref:hypothetical protein n=1 Tax=Mesorhizobium amorphae TaxID=71433 RepID=UPI003ECEA391